MHNELQNLGIGERMKHLMASYPDAKFYAKDSSGEKIPIETCGDVEANMNITIYYEVSLNHC